ncbi:MAG: histidine kinase N-terminal 7TM domain-containing protein [Patescibacteria group bacterium]
MLASIFPLVSSIIFLSFAAAVFLSDTRARVKYIFVTLCLATFWWQFSWFILFNTHDAELALLISKIGYIGVLFLPVLLYQFILIITDNRSTFGRIILYVSYTISTIFLILLLTSDAIISGVSDFSWGFYPKAGSFHPALILLTFILMVSGLLVLWKRYRETRSFEKQQQIRFLLYAIILYNLSSIDFIANYEVNIYPISFIALGFFIFLIWQGISHHYLLKISNHFKYILSYIFVFIYMWIATELYIFLFKIIGVLRLSPLDELSRLFVTAILAGVGIIIYHFSTKFIEQALYKYRNPNRLLIKIHEEIIDCESKKELLETMSQILDFVFSVDHAYVLVKNDADTKDNIEIITSQHSSKKHPLGIGSLKDFAGTKHNLPQELITIDNLKYFALLEGTQEKIIEEMKINCIAVIAPMYYEENFIGNLILGEKPYQERYTEEEKRFIERIVPLFAKKLATLKK